MSLFRVHLKKLISQAASHGCFCSGSHRGLSNQGFLLAKPLPCNPTDYIRKGLLVASTRLYSTPGETLSGPDIRKKKEKPNARKVIGNVGRLIPYNIIQVINYNGEDLGRMSRRNVIKILEERDLKLVLLRENSDPPLYKLMTGKQIFEQQTKLREKQKLQSSSGHTQIKESSFLSRISQHDLDIKMKQISEWIEKKHHVQITVINSKTSESPDNKDVLQQVIKFMENHAICSSNPKERQDGRAICVLRPLSAKELQKQKKNQQDKSQEEQTTAQMTNQEQSQDTESPNP